MKLQLFASLLALLLFTVSACGQKGPLQRPGAAGSPAISVADARALNNG